MTDEIILQSARLMKEQAADFARLESSCQQLAHALIQGDPTIIDSLTRVGEAELLQMRSRLVRIIQSLTAFAEARANSEVLTPLSAETRGEFESASRDLLDAARKFQSTRGRAATLTTAGSTFASACIEMCGIQPTTYSGPYSRGGDSRWA